MKCLVAGYGSIGARHAAILRELGCDVAVVSSRAVDYAPLFHDIDAALDAHRPDYVVVANDTAGHHGMVRRLARKGFSGTVLVEKPLFEAEKEMPEHGFKNLFVGYNLRFHPLLQSLRGRLGRERLVAASVYVGQYLPDWRPGTDYTKSYSASAETGGGVLRDLSHELDFSAWLFGEWTALAAIGGKFSDLAITSDDCFTLLTKTAKCPMVTIQMNYLDRIAKRELIVNTAVNTYHLDLLGGRMAWRGGEEKVAVERNHTYRRMHEAVVSGDHSTLCTLGEGMAVVKAITAAERAAKSGAWIENRN